MNPWGEGLPGDVIGQIRAMDPAITPQLVQDSWALLTPFHEKIGYGVVETWRARHGTVPGLVWVEGHNHISGIDETALGTAPHRFIARHTATEGAR